MKELLFGVVFLSQPSFFASSSEKSRVVCHQKSPTGFLSDPSSSLKQLENQLTVTENISSQFLPVVVVVTKISQSTRRSSDLAAIINFHFHPFYFLCHQFTFDIFQK
jgi:hypothetical protein